MMKSMKNMFLIAAMVATMVVSFAAPVMAAANDELQTTKANTVGPTVSDRSDGSSNDGSSSPVAEEAVKDTGISRCDITSSGCQGTNDQEDSASHDGASTPYVCIKAPCGDSSSSEEDDRVKDRGIRLCDITPTECQNSDDSQNDMKKNEHNDKDGYQEYCNLPSLVHDPACDKNYSKADPDAKDRSNSPVEEEKPLRDRGIRLCDITPTECQKNTEEDSTQKTLDVVGDQRDGGDGSSSNSDKVGQIADSGQLANSPTTYGCPFDYKYAEGAPSPFDMCYPPDFGLIDVFLGEKPWPDTFGGYAGLPVSAGGDLLTWIGLSGQLGSHAIEDLLVGLGEDDGGALGYGLQGLGYTIGFAGDAVGLAFEGAGEIVGAVADGVGEVVDPVVDNVVNPVLSGVVEGVEEVVAGVEKVADVATSAWKKITSWF